MSQPDTTQLDQVRESVQVLCDETADPGLRLTAVNDLVDFAKDGLLSLLDELETRRSQDKNWLRLYAE